jgi:hypothetical protein
MRRLFRELTLGVCVYAFLMSVAFATLYLAWVAFQLALGLPTSLDAFDKSGYYYSTIEMALLLFVVGLGGLSVGIWLGTRLLRFLARPFLPWYKRVDPANAFIFMSTLGVSEEYMKDVSESTLREIESQIFGAWPPQRPRYQAVLFARLTMGSWICGAVAAGLSMLFLTSQDPLLKPYIQWALAVPAAGFLMGTPGLTTVRSAVSRAKVFGPVVANFVLLLTFLLWIIPRSAN